MLNWAARWRSCAALSKLREARLSRQAISRAPRLMVASAESIQVSRGLKLPTSLAK